MQPCPSLTIRSILGLLVGAALLAGGPGHAGDASRCHSIQDADRRHLCLALGKGEPSRCHSIRHDDTRHGCLAQAKGERSRCHAIRDRDQREMCLALVPR